MKPLPESSEYYCETLTKMCLLLHVDAEGAGLLHRPNKLEVYASMPEDRTEGCKRPGGDARIDGKFESRIRVFLCNIYERIDPAKCVERSAAELADERRKREQDFKENRERIERESEVDYLSDDPLSAVLLHELCHIAQGLRNIGHNTSFLHICREIAPHFRLKAPFWGEDTKGWPFPLSKFGSVRLSGPSLRSESMKNYMDNLRKDFFEPEPVTQAAAITATESKE